MRTESLFCKQKIFHHFSVRPVPMPKRLGKFKKISAETLSLSSHKVALVRKNVFFALACFARQCGAGMIINEAAAEVFYKRESRKRRVDGKEQRRRKNTFTLMTRDVVFVLLFSPSLLHPLLSHDTVRGGIPTRVRKTKVRTIPVRMPTAAVRKGSAVRMRTVRRGQQCECQQCECDSGANDDSPNCVRLRMHSWGISYFSPSHHWLFFDIALGGEVETSFLPSSSPTQ